MKTFVHNFAYFKFNHFIPMPGLPAYVLKLVRVEERTRLHPVSVASPTEIPLPEVDLVPAAHSLHRRIPELSLRQWHFKRVSRTLQSRFSPLKMKAVFVLLSLCAGV